MKNMLKIPAVNAVSVSLFTAFYAAVSFAVGQNQYVAYVMIAMTILVVVLLLSQRRPYDEYHASMLSLCLIAALVLTMIAIAVFYLVILSEPDGFIDKLSFFISVHWAAVVLADLAYVLLCRRR